MNFVYLVIYDVLLIGIWELVKKLFSRIFKAIKAKKDVVGKGGEK